MSWMLFWKILFIAVMAVFTLMAVLVTVLGARDVRRLIAGLRDGDDSEDVDEADRSRAFEEQSLLGRTLIVFAGPAADPGGRVAAMSAGWSLSTSPREVGSAGCDTRCRRSTRTSSRSRPTISSRSGTCSIDPGI